MIEFTTNSRRAKAYAASIRHTVLDDPDRVRMAEWLGEEIKKEHKVFLMIHNKSDNVEYEGLHLDSMVRDGEGKIESVGTVRDDGARFQFKFDDIISLQVFN